MDIRNTQARLGLAPDGAIGPSTWAALFTHEGARQTGSQVFGQAMAEFGQDIATPLEVCHFLAQAGHETDGFRIFAELGGPAYFARYDWRKDLGNTQPGDGIKFRGRGIFQITGRMNYLAAGEALGVDLIANPDLACRPDISARTAILFWRKRGLGALADADNLVEITHRINGGQNGAEDRAARLARLKALFA